MANIVDYMEWRGDVSLDHAPLNEVDVLVFCQLSYLPMEGIVPSGTGEGDAITIGDASRRMLLDPGSFHDEYDVEFCRALVDTPRFTGLQLCGFRSELDPDREEQFCAVTVRLPDDEVLVAFRGTDGTLIGWKEDFNMSFRPTVPSQESARRYHQEVGEAEPGARIVAAGHSKGGNLAVYASVFAPVPIQERIRAVYTNDGPGFHEDVFSHDGFARIEGRINAYVPQTSLVGMMMGHEVDYTVVHSTETGLRQHDPMSWEVKGPHFVTLDRVTRSSQFVDRSLKDWVERLDPAQQEQFVDVVYGVVAATGVERTREFTDDWYRNASAVLAAYHDVDKETREVVRRTLGALVGAARENLKVFAPTPPAPKPFRMPGNRQRPRPAIPHSRGTLGTRTRTHTGMRARKEA